MTSAGGFPGTSVAVPVTSTLSRPFSTPRRSRRSESGGIMSSTTPRTSPEIGGMGHSMKRKEDARFLRGQGKYVDDVKLPGMLYLDIVRSPYAHAKILNIDASKAKAMPGVLAVITGKDLDAAGLAWMP